MKGIFEFLASRNGRIVRIVVGAALIIWGFFGNFAPGWIGYLLIVIGLIPLLAGIFDKCVFAPLFGLPFDGKKLRGS